MINKKQKENLTDFFRELSVATITIGGISVFFDKSLNFSAALIQFVFSLIAGTILLIASFMFIKS